MIGVNVITNTHSAVSLIKHHRHYNNQYGACAKWTQSVDPLFLERIDLQVEVEALPVEEMTRAPKGEPSALIRERVIRARKIQEQRFAGVKGIHCNAQMTTSMLHKYASIDETSTELLRTAMKRLDLSARAYDRILKVARTIADLDGSESIQSAHIAEAIGYRNLDRESWIE